MKVLFYKLRAKNNESYYTPKQHRFNNPFAATNIFNELVAQHT